MGETKSLSILSNLKTLMFNPPLFRPLLHGTYVDDAVFGVIFIVMLGIFLYFYFFDKGEAIQDDDEETGKKQNDS